MQDLDIRNVQNIANSEVFESDISVLLSQGGRFRDIASATLRQLLSTSLTASGAADPGESDKIANTTVFYIQTTDETLHVSLAGGNWIVVGGDAQFTDEEFQDKLNSLITAGSNISITYDDQNNTLTIAATDTNTQLTDEQLQDKIASFLAEGRNIALTYDDEAGQLTISSTATGDGSGGLTAEQVRDEIAAFIRGGTNITVTHDDDNDTLTLAATDTNTQLTDEQFQDKLNSLITAGSNITITYDDQANTFTIAATGTGGLSSVATDETLQGDGTAESPLGVNTPAGEVGKISPVGSYTFGTSATPAAQNAGYTGGSLYVHTTASDGDKSTILAGLSQGDYLYIGRTILKVTAAPTFASSVYTFAVTVLQGEVPASGSHTLYYITEKRALIAGAVHLFNLANGTPGDFLGYNGTGRAVAKENPLANLQIGKPTLISAWQRTGTNGGISGHFQPFDNSQSIPQLYINPTDDGGTNRREALLALGKGDALFVEGFNVLRITRVAEDGSINFYGEWEDDFSTRATPSSGATVNIYHIPKGASVGTTPIPNNILTFGSGYSLSSTPPAADDDDQFFSSREDLDIGIYETFGSWNWTSTSTPATGEFYIEATELKIFETDADGEDRANGIIALGVGDRLQFGDVNVFVVGAEGVRSGNGVFTFSGVWGDVFSVGDFDGEYTVRKIDAEAVVVRNTAVPEHFLKLDPNRQIIAHDPAESLTTETLWEGSLNPDNPGSTTTQMLNAGKKFSNYKLIFFQLRGYSRPSWEVIHTSMFESTVDYVELMSRNAALALQWVSDTQFVLSASTGTGIILRKIVGMRGL